MAPDISPVGDWNDFIEREEKEQRKSSARFGDGKKLKNQGIDNREDVENNNNTKIETLVLELKAQIAELREQLKKSNIAAGVSNPETEKQADSIKAEAQKNLDDIAFDKIPWSIKAEDIHPEHLAQLYSTGVTARILEKIAPEKIYRSRLKQVKKEIGEKHQTRDQESKFQSKQQKNIAKKELKREKLEKKVAFSEVRLKSERSRILEPAESRYQELQAKVNRLNQVQYELLANPIKKIANFAQKIYLQHLSLPTAKKNLENAKEKLRPKEQAHNVLTQDLNKLKANIVYAQKTVQESLDRISNLETELLALAGIESPQKQPPEKDSADSEQESPNTEQDKKKYAENKLEFIDRAMGFRNPKTEAGLDEKIKQINEKYGQGFSDQGRVNLPKYNYLAKVTEDGKRFFIKLYENQGKFTVVKELPEQDKKHSAEEKQAA